jgi:rare lipoprotein A
VHGPRAALYFRLLTLLILTLLLTGLTGCGAVRSRWPGTGESDKYPRSGKSYVINGKRYYLLASAEGYKEKGEASWYGGNFHGRKTANGEIYDMHALTAAHKTLPFNTWVKVTNLSNNREVQVRINDRGPFAYNRIIDLSYTAAKKLNLVGPGKAPVLVEALGTAEERTISGRVEQVLVQPKSYREGRFTIQVGSFRESGNAEKLAARLRRDYGVAQVEAFDRGDAVFYRVQVGDLHNLNDASDLQRRLDRQGYRDSFVVAR